LGGPIGLYQPFMLLIKACKLLADISLASDAFLCKRLNEFCVKRVFFVRKRLQFLRDV
jgi:hypothetical protein